MSEKHSWCFACGSDNPIGLKLEFKEENDKYITEFTPGPEHQSYNGMVHGGIISTLLDEVMGRYINIKTGKNAFTARLEVRYRHHTPINQPLKIVGSIERKKGRLYEMKAVIQLPDGNVTAEGKAKILVAEN